MRIFAGDRVRAIMDKLNVPEDEAIEAGMVSRSIESAQRKVEGRNFDIRKQLLEYDDVANEQRKIIYAQRNEILESESVRETVQGLRHGALEAVFRDHIPEESVEEMWDIEGLQSTLANEYHLEVGIKQWIEDEPQASDEDFLKRIISLGDDIYQTKLELVGEESFNKFEKTLLLQSIDTHWREHLASLDHLRQGIHLRGYAQKNPKQEYKREAFELFGVLLNTVRDEVAKVLLTVRVQSAEEVKAAESAMEERASHLENVQYQHAQAQAEQEQLENEVAQAAKPAAATRHVSQKVGRNEPCPCGSGKKYKHCHGQIS